MIKEQEMQYTYEFEMWRGEFAWIAAPFDLVASPRASTWKMSASRRPTF